MSESASSVKTTAVDKTDAPKDKKSKTWLWILLAGLGILVIIVIVIIIIAVFGGFSNSDNQTSEPPPLGDPSQFVYNSTNSGGVVPTLVQTGPNYLTDQFSASGSINNPLISTQNAIGWVLTNNSPFSMFVYFLYASPSNNINVLQTNVPINPGTTVSWKSTSQNYSNIPLPFFSGMTFKFFQDNGGVGVTQPLYLIPATGINPSTDVILLRYNEDNSVTSAIVNSTTGVTSNINISS